MGIDIQLLRVEGGQEKEDDEEKIDAGEAKEERSEMY